MKSLILTGFMGCGKTTVGKKLADCLKLDFLDTDDLIEKKYGQSISRIFEELGEEAFRNMETALLQELLKEEVTAVISSGGGLVLRKQNAEMLKKIGDIVYLFATEDTILQRVKKDRNRPLLKGDNLEEKIHSIMTEREEIYSETAGITVKTDGRTLEEICDEIMQHVITAKGE